MVDPYEVEEWVSPAVKRAFRYPMIAYDPHNSNHGTLLLHWYCHLVATGDMNRLFTHEAHALQDFLRVFEDKQLFFWCDDKGIYVAAWTAPCLGAVFFSLWIREDKRHSKQAYCCVCDAYDAVFHHWPTLMGLTKQKALLDEHVKMGYTIEGRIPQLWDGFDAWLVVLTKENYYGHRSAASRRQKSQHERV